MKLGYKAFYQGKTKDFYAESLWDAKQKAIQHFKPSQRNLGLVHVYLCEKDGEQVVVCI